MGPLNEWVYAAGVSIDWDDYHTYFTARLVFLFSWGQSLTAVACNWDDDHIGERPSAYIQYNLYGKVLYKKYDCIGSGAVLHWL